MDFSRGWHHQTDREHSSELLKRLLRTKSQRNDDEMGEKKTRTHMEDKSLNKTSNFARPYTHTSLTNPSLTEVPATEELDKNDKRAISREAVAKFHAKRHFYYRGNASHCPGMFALEVLRREKLSQNYISSARLNIVKISVKPKLCCCFAYCIEE